MACDNELHPDPVIEAYKRDVDRTLLRRNLKLTVEERLLQLVKLQELAQELRRAGNKASLPDNPRPDRRGFIL
jgi:hypothetical protein